MKILIVEDDLTTRLMLQALTAKWGFEAILAEGGEQALDILQGSDAPRLVLLDWEMPGMSGPEVCEKVRETATEDPPYIILLTIRNKKKDIVVGLDAGANDHVAKPFDNSELRARLKVGVRMLNLQSKLYDARQKLAEQATHDTLTGLLNRGAVVEALKREFARTRRAKTSLYVGLCDLDHFKQVNDTYGHLAGDAVLQELARRFNRALRSYDHVGRYGGEEFLIILNNDNENIKIPFDRILESVAETPFQYEEIPIPMTISIGIAQWLPSPGNNDVNQLLARADKMLYKAKANGRNCIAFA